MCVGASVQSTTGSRGVRISGSNVGYTMFQGSVKSTSYPLHLNRREGGGRQFSRLLAAEVCTSAVVMLDTPCSEVAWTVLAIHSIRQFPLHFPSCASPCTIIFQLESTICCTIKKTCEFYSHYVVVCSQLALTSTDNIDFSLNNIKPMSSLG